MDFFYGVLFTVAIEAVGYFLYTQYQRRKARAAYIPPSGGKPQATYKDK